MKSIMTLVNAVKEVIEETPPELVSDIMHRGITIVGGGSYLRGLAQLLEEETKIPVNIAEDPLTAVVRGTGIVLEDIDKLRDILVEDEEDDMPPQ